MAFSFLLLMGAVTGRSKEQCFEVIAAIVYSNVVFDGIVIVGTSGDECRNSN